MSDTTTFEISDSIMAMTEDDGTVVTLLKRDQEHGAVYRHDSEWHPLVDPTVLDNLAFVGVSASAEAIYDRYESEDQLVNIGHYNPSADGPFWPHPVVDVAEPESEGEIPIDDDDDSDVADETSESEEPVTASVVLNGAEDLDAAIAAAAIDPDLRWYVERRVAALGLEASLPWQQKD